MSKKSFNIEYQLNKRTRSIMMAQQATHQTGNSVLVGSTELGVKKREIKLIDKQNKEVKSRQLESNFSSNKFNSSKIRPSIGVRTLPIL